MNFKSYLTGRYERQIGGYSAYIPAPMPNGNRFEIDGELLAQISRADRAIARLDGSVDNLPDTDLFVMSYVRREAVVSSQIEGTQASLSDVIKAEAELFSHHGVSDVGEIINYIAAMRHGLSRLKDTPITTNLICEMHAALLHGVRGEKKFPGMIRTTQNWIGGSGTQVGDAVFVPPPPGNVRDSLHELEKFINLDQGLPLLVKIALAHAQFETIHPFLDGNGRVGRMLIPLMLLQAEALAKPVLYISHYFRRHRQAYMDRLQATREDGDLRSWVQFFLMAIIAVAEDATRVSRAITSLREEDRKRIVDAMPRGAGKALALHERLFRLPIITVNQAAATMGVTFGAANSTIAKLVQIGVLTEATGKLRDRAFLYDSYYRLFEPRVEKS